MDKTNLFSYLGLLKDKKLEQIDTDKLIPNHAYLFYSVDSEFSGRKVYHYVDIVAGFYDPRPHPEGTVITKALSISYTLRGDDGAEDIVNDLRKHKIPIKHKKRIIVSEYSGYTVYKLPVEPIKKERVQGMSEAMEELRYVPADDDKWFIGEKYREAKKSFERKQGTRKRSKSNSKSKSKSPNRTTSKSRSSSKSSSRSRSHSK